MPGPHARDLFHFRPTFDPKATAKPDGPEGLTLIVGRRAAAVSRAWVG
jgi:hypothetical protein